MTLLAELRNVEPGKPGHWSRRVSVTLACVVLVLVTAVGLSGARTGNAAAATGQRR